MAALTLQHLKKIINDAFAAGYGTSLELKDEYVEKTVDLLLAEPPPKLTVNDGWKIWKIKELQCLTDKTIVEHNDRGKGYINYKIGIKWEDDTFSSFINDAYPWNEPMRIVKAAVSVSKQRQRNYIDW